MRGRKPYPFTVMETNNTKNRIGKEELKAREKNEPKLERCDLKCPAHLPEDVVKEWERITALYKELEDPIINELDFNALEVYCENMVTYRQAMAKVHEKGDVVMIKGEPRKNPWLIIANEAANQVKKYGEILLLDPVSRARVGLARTKTEDLSPLELMRQRKLKG